MFKNFLFFAFVFVVAFGVQVQETCAADPPPPAVPAVPAGKAAPEKTPSEQLTVLLNQIIPLLSQHPHLLADYKAEMAQVEQQALESLTHDAVKLQGIRTLEAEAKKAEKDAEEAKKKADEAKKKFDEAKAKLTSAPAPGNRVAFTALNRAVSGN